MTVKLFSRLWKLQKQAAINEAQEISYKKKAWWAFLSGLFRCGMYLAG